MWGAPEIAANAVQSSMLREELRKANDMLNEGEHGAESSPVANEELFVSLPGPYLSEALIAPATSALYTHCTQAARCRAATARASPPTTQCLSAYAASGAPLTTRLARTVVARRSYATLPQTTGKFNARAQGAKLLRWPRAVGGNPPTRGDDRFGRPSRLSK